MSLAGARSRRGAASDDATTQARFFHRREMLRDVRRNGTGGNTRMLLHGRHRADNRREFDGHRSSGAAPSLPASLRHPERRARLVRLSSVPGGQQFGAENQPVQPTATRWATPARARVGPRGNREWMGLLKKRRCARLRRARQRLALIWFLGRFCPAASSTMPGLDRPHPGTRGRSGTQVLLGESSRHCPALQMAPEMLAEQLLSPAAELGSSGSQVGGCFDALLHAADERHR